MEKPGYQRRNLHFIKLPSGWCHHRRRSASYWCYRKKRNFWTYDTGSRRSWLLLWTSGMCGMLLFRELASRRFRQPGRIFWKKISRRYWLHRKMGRLFKTSVHSDQQTAYGSVAYRYIRRTCRPLLYRWRSLKNPSLRGRAFYLWRWHQLHHSRQMSWWYSSNRSCSAIYQRIYRRHLSYITLYSFIKYREVTTCFYNW